MPETKEPRPNADPVARRVAEMGQEPDPVAEQVENLRREVLGEREASEEATAASETIPPTTEIGPGLEIELDETTRHRFENVQEFIAAQKALTSLREKDLKKRYGKLWKLKAWLGGDFDWQLTRDGEIKKRAAHTLTRKVASSVLNRRGLILLGSLIVTGATGGTLLPAVGALLGGAAGWGLAHHKERATQTELSKNQEELMKIYFESIMEMLPELRSESVTENREQMAGFINQAADRILERTREQLEQTHGRITVLKEQLDKRRYKWFTWGSLIGLAAGAGTSIASTYLLQPNAKLAEGIIKNGINYGPQNFDKTLTGTPYSQNWLDLTHNVIEKGGKFYHIIRPEDQWMAQQTGWDLTTQQIQAAGQTFLVHAKELALSQAQINALHGQALIEITKQLYSQSHVVINSAIALGASLFGPLYDATILNRLKKRIAQIQPETAGQATAETVPTQIRGEVIYVPIFDGNPIAHQEGIEVPAWTPGQIYLFTTEIETESKVRYVQILQPANINEEYYLGQMLNLDPVTLTLEPAEYVWLPKTNFDNAARVIIEPTVLQTPEAQENLEMLKRQLWGQLIVPTPEEGITEEIAQEEPTPQKSFTEYLNELAEVNLEEAKDIDALNRTLNYLTEHRNEIDPDDTENLTKCDTLIEKFKNRLTELQKPERDTFEQKIKILETKIKELETQRSNTDPNDQTALTSINQQITETQMELNRLLSAGPEGTRGETTTQPNGEHRNALSRLVAESILYRMTEADIQDLNDKTLEGGQAKFVQKTREVWRDLAVHGQAFWQKEKDGKMHLYIRAESDMDSIVCIGLFKLAHLDTSSVRFVKPGMLIPGATMADTGNMDGINYDPVTGQIVHDHHTEYSDTEHSASYYVYQALLSQNEPNNPDATLLIDSPELQQVIAFTNQVDNLNYSVGDREYYVNQLPQTLFGVYRSFTAGISAKRAKEQGYKPSQRLGNPTFDQLIKFFKDGHKPDEDLTQLSAEDLAKYGFVQTYKRKNGSYTKNLIENQRKNNQDSIRILEEIDQAGFILDSPHGRIAIDLNGRVAGKMDAARAYGCDIYISWEPKKNGFFVSSTSPLPKDFNLNQGMRMRQRMHFQPENHGEDAEGIATETLLNILSQFQVTNPPSQEQIENRIETLNAQSLQKKEKKEKKAAKVTAKPTTAMPVETPPAAPVQESDDALGGEAVAAEDEVSTPKEITPVVGATTVKAPETPVRISPTITYNAEGLPTIAEPIESFRDWIVNEILDKLPGERFKILQNSNAEPIAEDDPTLTQLINQPFTLENQSIAQGQDITITSNKPVDYAGQPRDIKIPLRYLGLDQAGNPVFEKNKENL